MCNSHSLPPPFELVDTFDVEDLTGIDLGDIVYDNTSKIHPMFCRRNFVPGWTDQDYDALAPILRLATVYLESPHSIRFLHTVFFGKLIIAEHPMIPDTLVDTVDGLLTTQQKDDVRMTLEMLSHGVITFAADRNPLPGSNGRTRAIRERFSPLRSDDPRGLRGRQCEILTDKAVPASMLLLNFTRETFGSTPENIRTEMLFIHEHMRLFLHEFAHAAIKTRVADCLEPHMEKAGNASEMGFNYEYAVFGGLIDDFKIASPPYCATDSNGVVRYSPPSERMVASHVWPHPGTVRMYLKRGNPISVRGDEYTQPEMRTSVPLRQFATQLQSGHCFPERGVMATKPEVWTRTPLRQLAAQFKRAFWEAHNSEDSGTAVSWLGGPRLLWYRDVK